MSLAKLSYTSLAFNNPHVSSLCISSFRPLFQLVGGGNNCLGITYYHHISISFATAIDVVPQLLLKFNLISSEASSVPSIRSYCALNVVISVCHISLIDAAGGRLFVENTLVHLVIHMHHMLMGASNIHRSPNFCFFTITAGTLLSMISRIVAFSPLYTALHVLSYFSISSSRLFQQA